MERMLKRPDLLLERARKYSEQGDWRACLKACQMALFCEPRGDLFAAALYLKALSLVELGRVDEAWMDIRKVETLLALYPEYATHAAKLKIELGRRRVI
ncbi:MAG: hypothetical protein ABL958_14365 [Bdellovibrionia bacterium]